MKRDKLVWTLVWIMSELHNVNVQHNDLFIHDIMGVGHKPEDWSVHIRVCIAHG